MRALFFTVLTVAAGGAVATLACTSDDKGTDLTAGDGSANDGDGGSSGDTPPGSRTDSGVLLSPTGCRLRTTDLQLATVGTSFETSPGAVAWENIPGAYAEDGDFAKVTLDRGQESQQLRLSGFGPNGNGFELAPTAEVWGIVVQLKRRALQDAGVRDIEINMVIDGQQPQGKFHKSQWPRGIVGTHDYGEEIDTWKLDTKVEWFNTPSFGIRFAIRREAEDPIMGPADALVDSIKVALWFCPEPDKKEN